MVSLTSSLKLRNGSVVLTLWLTIRDRSKKNILQRRTLLNPNRLWFWLSSIYDQWCDGLWVVDEVSNNPVFLHWSSVLSLLEAERFSYSSKFLWPKLCYIFRTSLDNYIPSFQHRETVYEMHTNILYSAYKYVQLKWCKYNEI